ncbi:MAG: stage III sporulation protein AD [Vallitaleaceae bacterium]|nr:stage III sporulation protein AD [Vallitaleaceae bacterium]
MEIVQVVIICLCATVFIVLLEKQKEFGIYISISVGAIIFFIFLDKFKTIVDLLNKINGFMNVDDVYMKILLQILGIAFITEFGATICKDAGQKAIASNIELAGKIIILVVAAPIILAIINLVETIV